MPELGRFNGLVISLFFADDEQHHLPHVHVHYGEYSASVSLGGEVLAGKLPSKPLKMLTEWLTLHDTEILTAWEHAVKMEKFDKID